MCAELLSPAIFCQLICNKAVSIEAMRQIVYLAAACVMHARIETDGCCMGNRSACISHACGYAQARVRLHGKGGCKTAAST